MKTSSGVVCALSFTLSVLITGVNTMNSASNQKEEHNTKSVLSVPEPVIADNEKAVEDFTESTRQTIKNIMGSNDMNDVLEKIRSGTILLPKSAELKAIEKLGNQLNFSSVERRIDRLGNDITFYNNWLIYMTEINDRIDYFFLMMKKMSSKKEADRNKAAETLRDMCGLNGQNDYDPERLLRWVDRRVHQLCSMPRKEDADAYAKNHLDINRITYAFSGIECNAEASPGAYKQIQTFEELKPAFIGRLASMDRAKSEEILDEITIEMKKAHCMVDSHQLFVSGQASSSSSKIPPLKPVEALCQIEHVLEKRIIPMMEKILAADTDVCLLKLANHAAGYNRNELQRVAKLIVVDLFHLNVISDMCVMLDPAKNNDTKEYFESNKNEVTQIINALVAWVQEVPKTIWPELTRAFAYDTISKYLKCNKLETKAQLNTLAEKIKVVSDQLNSERLLNHVVIWKNIKTKFAFYITVQRSLGYSWCNMVIRNTSTELDHVMIDDYDINVIISRLDIVREQSHLHYVNGLMRGEGRLWDKLSIILDKWMLPYGKRDGFPRGPEGVHVELGFLSHFAKKPYEDLRRGVFTDDDKNYVAQVIANKRAMDDRQSALQNGTFSTLILLYDQWTKVHDATINGGSLLAASSEFVGGYELVSKKIHVNGAEDCRYTVYLLV